MFQFGFEDPREHGLSRRLLPQLAKTSQKIVRRNVLPIASTAVHQQVFVSDSDISRGHGCFSIVLIYTGRSFPRLAIKLRATIRDESIKESSYHRKTSPYRTTPSQGFSDEEISGIFYLSRTADIEHVGIIDIDPPAY